MKNTLKIILVVFFDIVLLGGALLLFAWFHHARPQHFDPVVINSPIPDVTEYPVTQTPAPTDTPLPPDVTPAPTPDVTETPEPWGLLGGRFADKFTDGDPKWEGSTYRSQNVCVEITEHSVVVKNKPVHYFVADIYIRDISSLRCDFPNADSGMRALDLAKRNGAIVATSGDYFVHRSRGIVIRNGVLYRNKLHSAQDICVLYRDGTMKTYLKGQINLDVIMDGDPYQAWSFGPRLLQDGEPMTEFNTTVAERNPRCAIGYYEPGHYCLVVVDGRQEGYSMGLEMEDLSLLMYELGCVEAYNLDGGSTSLMIYNDRIISKLPYGGGGRDDCDIIYIAEPIDWSNQ
ncbi:MAG: phosphodiester glycosidase family protein [Clostridia bacterium]|nr:phosphodiester glycosidase family protein [Clostridia bacterium]